MRQRVTPFAVLETPARPMVGEKVVHDPRDFAAGFDNARQPQQERLANIQDELKQLGIADLASFIAFLDARNIPPQLNQTGTYVKIAAVGVPVSILGKNLKRQSLMIANFQTVGGDIVASFDRPMQVGNIGGNATFAGFPIPVGTMYQESNGSISVNEIFVACNSATATYPIIVAAFEGSLSFAGNTKF